MDMVASAQAPSREDRPKTRLPFNVVDDLAKLWTRQWTQTGGIALWREITPSGAITAQGMKTKPPAVDELLAELSRMTGGTDPVEKISSYFNLDTPQWVITGLRAIVLVPGCERKAPELIKLMGKSGIESYAKSALILMDDGERAKALAGVNDQEIVKIVLDGMSSGHWETACACAMLAGEINAADQVRNKLVELANSETSFTKLNAIRSLVNIGWEGVDDLLINELSIGTTNLLPADHIQDFLTNLMIKRKDTIMPKLEKMRIAAFDEHREEDVRAIADLKEVLFYAQVA